MDDEQHALLYRKIGGLDGLYPIVPARAGTWRVMTVSLDPASRE
jgi:hypothetical protein